MLWVGKGQDVYREGQPGKQLYMARPAPTPARPHSRAPRPHFLRKHQDAIDLIPHEGSRKFCKTLQSNHFS